MNLKLLGIIVGLVMVVCDSMVFAAGCTRCRQRREPNAQTYKKQPKNINKRICTTSSCSTNYSRRKAQLNSAQKRAKKRHQRRGYRTQKQMDKAVQELAMKVRTMETTLANLIHDNSFLPKTLHHRSLFSHNELR